MIPIEHTQMKLIRENEIYLMEEAVTNNILKEASQIIDLHNESQELMSSQFMLSSDGFTSPHPIESGPTSPISNINYSEDNVVGSPGVITLQDYIKEKQQQPAIGPQESKVQEAKEKMLEFDRGWTPIEIKTMEPVEISLPEPEK